MCISSSIYLGEVSVNGQNPTKRRGVGHKLVISKFPPYLYDRLIPIVGRETFFFPDVCFLNITQHFHIRTFTKAISSGFEPKCRFLLSYASSNSRHCPSRAYTLHTKTPCVISCITLLCMKIIEHSHQG